MIVEPTDLRQALHYAAELDDARRRHPHDEGIRQRLRAAVGQVRRIARALELGGVLVLLISLVACGSALEPVPAPDACDAMAEAWCVRLERCPGRTVPSPECGPGGCGDPLEWCVPIVSESCLVQRSEPVEAELLDDCLAAVDLEECDAFGLPSECMWGDA